MVDDTKPPPSKPPSVWASYGPDYAVEKYDFKRHKKAKPPAESPQVVWPKNWRYQDADVKDE